MPGRMPESSLSMMVAQLTRFDPADRTAILAALEPRARKRVEAMMARDPDEIQASTAPDLSALSPWLADLVRTGRTMTPHAHKMLLESAAQLFEETALNAPSFRPSLLGRIGARLAGRKAA